MYHYRLEIISYRLVGVYSMKEVPASKKKWHRADLIKVVIFTLIHQLPKRILILFWILSQTLQPFQQISTKGRINKYTLQTNQTYIIMYYISLSSLINKKVCHGLQQGNILMMQIIWDYFTSSTSKLFLNSQQIKVKVQ